MTPVLDDTRSVRWERWAVPIMVAALAVPLIVALVRVWTPTWYPTSDLAQAEMHTRAIPLHPPLVGAAGRIGTILEQGSHPGPAGAVSLALPYRLLGSSSWSLMAAMVVVHLAAIAAALSLCRRTAGLAAAAVLAVVVAVMMRSFGTGWFLEPWNPWFGVFALLATIICAWRVWSGSTRTLPWFVVAASYCAQVHVGYAPVVGGLLLALVARLVVLHRRGSGPSRRSVASACLAAALLWLPPVVDQLTRDPGNLTLLWRHFSDPPDPSAGWRATLSAFVNEVNLFGSWSTGVDTSPSSSPTTMSWVGFIGLLIIAVAAVATARRRTDSEALRAWSVVGITTALSLVTVTRIFGPVNDYLVRWLSTIAAVVVTVAAWTLIRSLPRSRDVLSALAVLGAVSLGLAALDDATSPDPRDSHLLAELTPGVIGATDDDTTYLMRFLDPVTLGGTGFGIMSEMERRGREVVADSWLRAAVLPHRTVEPSAIDDRIDTVVWVVSGEPAIDDARRLTGAVVVAEADPRTPEEAETSDALRRRIEAALVDQGRADLIPRLDEQYGVSQVQAEPGLTDALREDLEDYRALRLPTAVVLLPVGSLP